MVFFKILGQLTLSVTYRSYLTFTFFALLKVYSILGGFKFGCSINFRHCVNFSIFRIYIRVSIGEKAEDMYIRNKGSVTVLKKENLINRVKIRAKKQLAICNAYKNYLPFWSMHFCTLRRSFFISKSFFADIRIFSDKKPKQLMKFTLTSVNFPEIYV